MLRTPCSAVTPCACACPLAGVDFDFDTRFARVSVFVCFSACESVAFGNVFAGVSRACAAVAGCVLVPVCAARAAVVCKAADSNTGTCELCSANGCAVTGGGPSACACAGAVASAVAFGVCPGESRTIGAIPNDRKVDDSAASAAAAALAQVASSIQYGMYPLTIMAATV